MANMENDIKPMMTKALSPGKYRATLIDLFFTKFQGKVDTQHLVDMAVPIYDKYLFDDDIKGTDSVLPDSAGTEDFDRSPQISR
jgi:hypothetical protein